MAKTLLNDVHADHFIPSTDQSQCNRPRRALADLDPVDRLHRDESWTDAGEKSLFRVVEVVRRVIPFDNLDAQLIRQIEDHHLSNSAEDVSVRGRADLAVHHQDKMVLARLA